MNELAYNVDDMIDGHKDHYKLPNLAEIITKNFGKIKTKLSILRAKHPVSREETDYLRREYSVGSSSIVVEYYGKADGRLDPLQDHLSFITITINNPTPDAQEMVDSALRRFPLYVQRDKKPETQSEPKKLYGSA